MGKRRVIKAERETILLTSEADETWDIYIQYRYKEQAAQICGSLSGAMSA